MDVGEGREQEAEALEVHITHLNEHFRLD